MLRLIIKSCFVNFVIPLGELCGKIRDLGNGILDFAVLLLDMGGHIVFLTYNTFLNSC